MSLQRRKKAFFFKVIIVLQVLSCILLIFFVQVSLSRRWSLPIWGFWFFMNCGKTFSFHWKNQPYCVQLNCDYVFIVPNFVPRLKRQKIQFGPKLTLSLEVNEIQTAMVNTIPIPLVQQCPQSCNFLEIISGDYHWYYQARKQKRFNVIYLVDFQYVNIGSSFMESSMLSIDCSCKERAHGSILICFSYWLSPSSPSSSSPSCSSSFSIIHYIHTIST